MRHIPRFLVAFVLISLLSCGPDLSGGPAVVPNLNGSWLVTVSLAVSLDGEWTCTIDQPVFNFVQITDTFTGTSQGGQANCVNAQADSSSLSLDGERIFNGLIDPAGNLAFNFQTIENLAQGFISADRNTITGSLNWSFLLPPTISVFFVGSWSAQRI